MHGYEQDDPLVMNVAIKTACIQSLYVIHYFAHGHTRHEVYIRKLLPFEQERAADNSDRAEGHCGTGHPRLKGNTNR